MNCMRTAPPMPTERWYTQGFVWLGLAILAASLMGCITLILLSLDEQQAYLDTGHDTQILGVPVVTSAQPNAAQAEAEPEAIERASPSAALSVSHPHGLQQPDMAD